MKNLYQNTALFSQCQGEEEIFFAIFNWNIFLILFLYENLQILVI